MRRIDEVLAELRRNAWRKLLFGALCLACALSSLLLPRGGAAAGASAAAHEWPAHWDGMPLRPLAPTDVEQRFARGFPGALARFAAADGRQLVMRSVQRPTRSLHPAADCYRAAGWRVGAARLERDAPERTWRCFEAERDNGARQRVCERIAGDDGSEFADSSAWFWSALAGRSQGPWLAVTVATPL